MSKYLVELTRFQASVILTFDDESKRLIVGEIQYGNMTPEVTKFLWNHFPFNVGILEHYRKMKNVKVSEVPEDVSFERFWEVYDYKVGKKTRAERLWKALTDTERIKALKHIRIYEQWLAQHPGIEKKYPETFLSQNPWNN